MKRTWKTLLGLLLALSMMVGMIPAVFAGDEQTFNVKILFVDQNGDVVQGDVKFKIMDISGELPTGVEEYTFEGKDGAAPIEVTLYTSEFELVIVSLPDGYEEELDFAQIHVYSDGDYESEEMEKDADGVLLYPLEKEEQTSTQTNVKILFADQNGDVVQGDVRFEIFSLGSEYPVADETFSGKEGAEPFMIPLEDGEYFLVLRSVPDGYVEPDPNDTLVRKYFTVSGGQYTSNDIPMDENGVLIYPVEKTAAQPAEYTVSFDPGEGSGTMDDAIVKEGEQLSLPECGFEPPENKEFDTWDKGDPGDKIDVSGNMTVTALWKEKEPAKTFTVKFDPNGGKGTMKDIVVIEGQKLTLPACKFTAPKGKEFDKWDLGKPGDKVDITADTTVKALWKDPSFYTVYFETNGGSRICPLTLKAGSDVDLTKYRPIRPGYTFAGWYIDKFLRYPVRLLCLNSDFTVYAKWTQNPGTGYTDVSSRDWFADDVAFVSDFGIMKGTGYGRFEPYRSTTRGMIAMILYRMEGCPVVRTANPYRDVAVGSYYEQAIAWAAGKGIIKGYGDGSFGPDDNVTREQLAAILYRYALYRGCRVKDRANLLAYVDSGDISEYAVESVSWAFATGLLRGTSGGRIQPTAELQRCEVSAMLHRFCCMYLRP